MASDPRLIVTIESEQEEDELWLNEEGTVQSGDDTINSLWSEFLGGKARLKALCKCEKLQSRLEHWVLELEMAFLSVNSYLCPFFFVCVFTLSSFLLLFDRFVLTVSVNFYVASQLHPQHLSCSLVSVSQSGIPADSCLFELLTDCS